MSTKLLPIVAIVSAMSFTVQADNTNTHAYVTDSYGNIIVDSWGACTRSINWTAETAIASCEKSNTTPVTKAIAADKPKKSCATKATNNDIKDNGLRGYAIDSDNYVVRDSWGACVRTIEWTEATEIARCEGKEETEVVVVEEIIVVAPVVVAPVIPAPAVVVAPVVKPTPAPIPTIAQLREFFDTNSAKLKPSAHAELDVYADFLTAYPNQKVTVTGHTDSRGEASYNQQLSEKRANAVKAYLVNKGIDASRMETHGAGETQPIADNKTREGRSKNRRVEVELIK